MATSGKVDKSLGGKSRQHENKRIAHNNFKRERHGEQLPPPPASRNDRDEIDEFKSPLSPWTSESEPLKNELSDIDDTFRDVPTLMEGIYDPTIEQSHDVVPTRPGKQLQKLRQQLVRCVADLQHNYAKINFDSFEINLRGIGKARVFDRNFTVVRTRKNLFILSNESLVDFQNQHHELMGMDLTKSSLYRTPSGKSLLFTVVTAADLEAMQKAGSVGGKMSAAVHERRYAHIDTETLLLPELDQSNESEGLAAIVVELEEFKSKIARTKRDPKSIMFFDPLDFAKGIELVMPFYDEEGKGYYLITRTEADKTRSYTLHVEPYRPQSPDMSQICLTFGDEFCTLITE